MALAFGPSHPSYFVKSLCKNEDKGCQWRSILGHQDKHVKTECKFEEKLECEFCDSVTASDELETHQNRAPTKANWREGCQKARVRCINCEDVIKRDQLDEHLNLNKSATSKERLDGCQNARIKCIHCDEELERQQLNEHLDGKHASPSRGNEAKQDEMGGKVKCTLCKGKFESWQLELKEERVNIKPEEKHLGLVVVMAWQAYEKWHELGLKLGIDSSNLDALRAKHNGSAKACFAEMISIWLKSSAKKSNGESPTYRGFIDALSSTAVDLKNVADSMEKSIKCEEVIIRSAKIKCIFCNREVPQYILSGHINLDPTQGKWLAGCDRANEKLTEGDHIQMKRKRGRDEESESEEQVELHNSRKVARIYE